MGDLGKIIVATGLELLPKIAQSGHTDTFMPPPHKEKPHPNMCPV